MTRRIFETLARFFDAAAVSTEALDIGQFGPPTKYTEFERVRLGPMVNAKARQGLLLPGGGGNSERHSRHGAFTRKWVGACSSACRAQAAEYWRLAESVDDDGEWVTGPKQLQLF